MNKRDIKDFRHLYTYLLTETLGSEESIITKYAIVTKIPSVFDLMVHGIFSAKFNVLEEVDSGELYVLTNESENIISKFREKKPQYERFISYKEMEGLGELK